MLSEILLSLFFSILMRFRLFARQQIIMTFISSLLFCFGKGFNPLSLLYLKSIA